MRIQVFLVLLFVSSIFAPLASGSSTETQFNDGSTSFSQTFTTSGSGTAGDITIPYGAEVTSAEFNLQGAPSSSSWSNLSTNADFGGAGTSSWVGQPPGMQQGYRNALEIENDEVQLRSTPTYLTTTFDNANSVSNLNGATLSTTGEYLSPATQDFKGVTSTPTPHQMKNGTWSYAGPTVNIGDERLVLMWSSSSVSPAPTFQRFNATTGEYNTSFTIQYSSCISSTLAYIYDIEIDGKDLWIIGRSNRYLSKWTINGNYLTCQQYWMFSSPYYPSGVSVDPVTDQLFVYLYQQQSPSYNHYLWQVNRASPSIANQTFLLGNQQDFISGNPAGLAVNGSRVTTNTQSTSYSYHHYFDFTGSWITHLGSKQFTNKGHYGLSNGEDGDLLFTCHYSNYCTASSRKVLRVGSGITHSASTGSSSSSILVTGPTTQLSKTMSEVGVSSLVAYTPGNSTIEIQLSVDGGTTWLDAALGQSLTFAQAGSQLVWRAWLNGTTSETPVLDMVTLSYIASFLSSGYMYVRSSLVSPVAATVWWNSTTPGGSRIDVSIQYGTSFSFTNSGQTKSITGTSSNVYLYFYFYSGTGNAYSPTLHDFNVQFYTSAPKNVELNLGVSGESSTTIVWEHPGTFLGTETATQYPAGPTGISIADRFNDIIPSTGTGTIDLSVGITSTSAGIVSIDSFSVTYTMQTVNLDIDYNSSLILHERQEPYEVVTRHIIGELSAEIDVVKLIFNAQPLGMAPLLEWDTHDSQPTASDPENWISIDPTSWMNESNGILEVHWRFKVLDDFPEQSNVRFTTSCTDSEGRTPSFLAGEDSLIVNHSFGMGWMNVQDNDGLVQWQDIPDNNWIAAGETIHFQGQLFFQNSFDAPKDNAFDIRVAQGSFVHSSWRDISNQNGTFFVSIDVPTIDVPDGVTYEVQSYNERDPTRVEAPDHEWRRTYRIDGTAPEAIGNVPLEGSYEAATDEQTIKFHVADATGSPTELNLNYWIEAEHDSNRNGIADADEYVQKIMSNNTDAAEKWFFTTIDDSHNPNMAKVSYYVSGTDPAGNPLKYLAGMTNDEEPIWMQYGPGFGSDTATYLTRKDSDAVFTGLEWIGHFDDTAIYAGTEQTILLGLLDANTVIDFEHISLIFDFEGPDASKDQQLIAFSGVNNTFWSESEYITLSPSSHVTTTINETGMPWIKVAFNFRFSWDWPDEEWGDLAFVYKERGSVEATRLEFADNSFRVENDLVLSASSFLVSDVTEPRVGPIADGSRVRSDDRLSFSGKVIFEGSDTPAPLSVGIKVDVFDGVSIWSDGSLDDTGGYTVEVPLSAATSLASSETRVCLISISGIPGRGQDMTGSSVSTTLRVVVDHTPPRITHRTEPIDVIDISDASDLSSVNVAFTGSEDADLTGSKQFVNWVMRDHTNTMTIASGITELGMQQDGMVINWTGSVDITNDGIVTPRAGDLVGFWVTGYDAAGNSFLEVGNSASNPIAELAEADGDYELSWLTLGAEVTELSILDISVDDDHISPGASVTIEATIQNTGGATANAFSVNFYAGDSQKAFHTSTIQGISEGETLIITTSWSAEEGVDRVRVVVDVENVIIEVNEEDNSAEHGIEVAYVSMMGWLDSPRESPLAWIFAFVSILVLITVFTIANKTALHNHEGSLLDDDFDDDDFEDDDFEEDEFEDYEDDDYEDDDDD
ncbi:MAG: hypothetical protein HOF90_04945 [Euryarchaeota archaeon]|nr:hypothetical protein [Euryarchaeota archaeon]